MSFDARQSVVGRLLNDAIYRIPRNQRMYVWKEDNWNDLFQDIELVTNGVSSSHFIGSIVLMEEVAEEGLSVFTIIDGQQRIITLTILLSSILYAFKRRGLFEDAGGTKKYLVATDVKNNEHVIVSPGNHLTLERIVLGVIEVDGTSASSTTPTAFAKERCASATKDSLIVKAFQHFSTCLERMPDDKLIAFRNAVISTSYVSISSSTEEDSYTIFEILNARGIELEDHELLKNYIMRYINPVEKRDDAKIVWSEIEQLLGSNMKPFLRQYAIQRYRLTQKDKEGPYKKIRDSADPVKASELLFDLKKKAEYYAEIVTPTTGDRNAEILLFFKAHNVKVFRPLLMSLMHCRDREQISLQEYSDSLEFIYRFYICYKVVGGMESNHLTDSIGKHSYLLEKECSPEVIEEWRKSFGSKLPSIEAFKTSLSALGWSHQWTLYEDNKLKDRCKLVLSLLELSMGGAKELGEYTIEHVLPDSAGEQNALIGNLLPLESGLNARCKDKPIEKKLVIYRESRFVTTRKFAERYEKRELDVARRTAHIADALYKQFQM